MGILDFPFTNFCMDVIIILACDWTFRMDYLESASCHKTKTNPDKPPFNPQTIKYTSKTAKAIVEALRGQYGHNTTRV